MKTMKPTNLILFGLGLLLSVRPGVWAQPVPHHLSGLTVLPDKTAMLSLEGSVSNMFNLTGTISNQFMQMFDLYPIEASSNLLDWTRLALLLRPNNDLNPLLFQDTNAVGLSQCFYRAPTNHLLTAFPKPTGPFAVGTVDRVMIDPARTNLYRYTPPTNAFMVTFWYPADPPIAGILPAAMWDQRFAKDNNAAAALGFDAQWTRLVAPKLVGHRFGAIPLAAGSSRHPVILFSHGLAGGRKIQSQVAEELASHGYVVVAMDHPDCWATEFPDGRYLAGRFQVATLTGDVPGRLRDMQFLLDALVALNQSDPLFASRLDLDRIGVYGLSFGGAVVETCRSDDRVQCAALYDVMNVQLNSAGLQKPFLVALGESNLFYSQDQWLFGKAATNAVFLQIRGAEHSTAIDTAWLWQTPQGRSPALAINACMLWFFNTYLKGETPPFPTNPEIYNVQRK